MVWLFLKRLMCFYGPLQAHQTSDELPVSAFDERLAAGTSSARFIVEIFEQLDLKPMERAYGTSGVAPFHPALFLSILVCGYATAMFSSCKLENANYDSVAPRFVVAVDEHPDDDTLDTFRKRFLKEIEALMVQVMVIARTFGVPHLGYIVLDSSKLKANLAKCRQGQLKSLWVPSRRSSSQAPGFAGSI